MEMVRNDFLSLCVVLIMIIERTPGRLEDYYIGSSVDTEVKKARDYK